jgi:integrase
MSVRQVKVHGKKRWQARVAYRGGRLSRLCDSKDEAKLAEADLLRTLVKDAEEAAKSDAAPATLATLCEAYVLDLEARGKAEDSITRAKDTVRRLADYFGARMQEPLALREADLYAFRTWRLRQWAKLGKPAKDGKRALLPGGVKASTVNRDLRTLRAMLKRALPGFRFPAGVFLPEDETRVKWLKPEDEVLAFASIPGTVRIGPKQGYRPVPFRDMARLAAITLMRLSEIRTLRREQVDLAQGVVILPRTKTTPRHVVLNTEAQAILARALEAAKGNVVFPNPDGRPYTRVYIGRVWRQAARAAGLSDFHFHDLRHHGATVALNAGFTASIVMALGGWKTERMMRRYAAVTDKTLRAAAEAISSGGAGPRQSTANLAVATAAGDKIISST